MAAQTHLCIAKSPHSQRTGSCYSVCARAFVAVFCTCCSEGVAVASRTLRVWRHENSTHIDRFKRSSSGAVFMASVQVRVQLQVPGPDPSGSGSGSGSVPGPGPESGPGLAFDFRSRSCSQVGCSGSDSDSSSGSYSRSGPAFILSVLRGQALVSELLSCATAAAAGS